MNASYTTELVVELATIGRVNISSDISIHHTGLLTYLLALEVPYLSKLKCVESIEIKDSTKFYQ